uniref:Uncharacterized protein AlNc14C262G9826 n=1 Tax=Albugo laibachii Nc14 TaxID=890382 RepID=F0WU03_9STRA|nr:conserved hypothetical protein [Albugo laibachii Nc14]|eukprot:CCA24847.1 conserved hypothetical protein [Albugo laibachii Nc14]
MSDAPYDPNISTSDSSPPAHKHTCESPPKSQHKKRSRVVFEMADIIEFEPTLFTTSVTSGGIPLGMSLKERSRVRRRLDSFEMERQQCRIGRQSYMEEGYINPLEREWILCQAGCAEHTIVQVEAQVNEIIEHRRESNEADFAYMVGLGGFSGDDIEVRVDSDVESEEDRGQESDPEDKAHANESNSNSIHCNAESNSDRKHSCVADRGKEPVYDPLDTKFQPQAHVCNDLVAA